MSVKRRSFFAGRVRENESRLARKQLLTKTMHRFFSPKFPHFLTIAALVTGAFFAATQNGANAANNSNNASSGPVIPGSRAMLCNGIAYAPSNAPENVKRAIWAVNALRRLPYKWGGGHGSFSDSGYDCSGTVSFALHHAGLLGQPLPSAELLSFGQRGSGRWITVFTRRGHAFAMIAGLRLDTTDFRTGRNVGPRWHVDTRSTWGFAARHPAGL